MPSDAQLPIALSEEVERYLRERVSLEVDSTVPAVVAQEEQRRFRHLKWLVALVGLVGLGTFGTLSNYLIEKAVESRLESRTGNISDALDFVRFSSLTLKLDLGTSFSKEDRVAIMNYLRRTATNDRMRHTKEFNAALVQVIESFAAAGQDSSIEEICQLYERELLSSDTTVEILLHHFGQLFVMHSKLQPTAFTTSFFEKLESLSAGAKVPELAHVYRLLQLHAQKPDAVQTQVSEILDRALMNTPDDLARFFQELLIRTNADNWQNPAGLSGELLQDLTRKFFQVYAEDLFRRTSIPSGEFLQIAAKGVDKEDASKVAKILSGRAKAKRAAA